MSIASEITRINNNIANAYTQVNAKGGTLPATQNSNNLATAISNIQTGITPTGTTNITQNGVYDVTNYASADVSVSGGSSTTFEYDNWIAYGTSEPSASSYNYWLPVATTPINAPLRYVDNYKVDIYFTGELAELVNQNTGSNYHRSANLPAGAVHKSGSSYFWASSGGNITANTNLYRLTSADNPMIKFGNTADSTNIGSIQTLLGLANATIYGCWTITSSGNTLDGCFGDSIYQYDISTGAISTRTRFNSTLLSSSNRGLGLFLAPDAQYFLIFRTSGTAVQVIRAKSGTNITPSAYASLTIDSNNTSYVASMIDTNTRDEYLLCYKTTGSINFTTYPLYMYKYSTNTFTQLTPPTNTGTVTIKQVAPMVNSKLFYFSALPNDVYFLENGQFVKVNNIGNLFKACCEVGLNAIAALDVPNNSFEANIPKNNFSIKDDQNVSHTYSFNVDNGYSYDNISGLINKNYSFGSEGLENYNSSDNVLLISNYQGTSVYNIQGYKFYPKSNKNIFLWIYRNGIAKFIYNKQEYSLYVSKNGEWTTNDSDNIII